MPTIVYAAKFVCGVMPPSSAPAEEQPVEPGSYATAINVHNPNPAVVAFAKKAVLLFAANEKEAGFELPKSPGELYRAELGPDGGMRIDCLAIRQELLKGTAPPAPVFIEGWVVIESPEPLDVVGVYTAQGSGAVCITTDRVVPAQP
jgi:hypothetical protein